MNRVSKGYRVRLLFVLLTFLLISPQISAFTDLHESSFRFEKEIKSDLVQPGAYIDDVFGTTATNSLHVGEYEFIAHPSESGQSRGLRYAKKNGRIVNRFSSNLSYPSPTWMGTGSLLGDGSIQFFHVAWTGGAQCCVVYRIFDVRKGKLTEVFRGDRLWLRDPIKLFDFNDDGFYEISQEVNDFRYFDSLCGSCSPWISIVFKYDKKRRKYLPARLYTPNSYDYIQDTKLEILYINKYGQGFMDRWEYLSMHLTVLLGHVYAGERKKGWRFFDKHYLRNDKAKQRGAIRKRMQESSLYNAIYGRH